MKSCNFPLWEPSKPYACPPDASPGWRELFEAGYDMAVFEENLKRSPEERLERNDRLANEILKREEFFEMLRRGKTFIQKVESGRKRHEPTNK